MVCRHCGKEFPDDAKYCPYCAEPVSFVDRLTEEEKVEYERTKQKFKNTFAAIIIGIVVFVVSWIAIYLWNGFDILFNDADYYGGWTITIISLAISVFISGGMLLIERFGKGDEKTRLISAQFSKDQTSICPQCGSHNIKVYRKGYNYHTGFWGSIFGVRGAGYAGGFDANKACCRCMNCGNDWETDYDYRIVK